MIFGFFSRWKKASKATGITGGAGKLCAFDKDGNVVSAGVTAADVGKYYRHCIRIEASGDWQPGNVYFEIINKSSAALNTWAKVRDATPTTRILATGGYYDYINAKYTVAAYIKRQGTGATANLRVYATYYGGETHNTESDAYIAETNIAGVTDEVTEIK